MDLATKKPLEISHGSTIHIQNQVKYEENTNYDVITAAILDFRQSEWVISLNKL